MPPEVAEEFMIEYPDEIPMARYSDKEHFTLRDVLDYW